MGKGLPRNICQGSSNDFIGLINLGIEKLEVPGLGLAIVKHIIEAHQEKLLVESTPVWVPNFLLHCNRLINY